MRGAGPGAALLARAGGSRWGPLPLRALLPPLPRRGFAATLIRKSYDVRRVEITPLEQRKVTFDTHALVQDLEAHGFGKEQAETIVSALITLSNVSLDTVYKDMVTQAQQEITLQQIMAHLDSIRKDMVILEKSEFANLRAENENETGKIRADSKLDINLERSRVTDMFTDQERKLMEATTEFHKKDSSTNSLISEISNKIDTEIASLKTLMESNKLDTIRYLAGLIIKMAADDIQEHALKSATARSNTVLYCGTQQTHFPVWCKREENKPVLKQKKSPTTCAAVATNHASWGRGAGTSG
ncbi:coiled-coil domain-containing protein 90B, mitochondrial isoform X2 [Pelecanus crispus]|uniref:coiled-coil domain-containing protein 90B, mitochondrial isoform X2 n=1 Tax=Pelecanus crispus TaxID=36300 RepID=UPI003F5D4CC0